MAKNKFYNKDHHAIVSIMSALSNGEQCKVSDIVIDNYSDESIRRLINEGSYFGALRKCVDRSGRANGEIVITDLGRDWWTATNTEQSSSSKAWWEEEVTYPDYYDMYDHPNGPDHLLNPAEIAECERIQTIIRRKDYEENKRLEMMSRLPAEGRLAVEQEANGTITPLDQRMLDVHRMEGKYKLPPKPAHARSYKWVEFEGETLLMDIEDIDDSVKVISNDDEEQ